MDRLLHEHRGTRVVQVDPQTLRFEARGTVGTAILMLMTAGTVVANAAILIPAALDGREVDGEIVAPWLMVLVTGLGLAWLVRRRSRSRGVFVVDGKARTIGRDRGIERWSLDDVSRLDLPMDPVRRRGAETEVWLRAHLPANRTLMLCRGRPRDLEPVLSRLEALGLKLVR